MSKVSIPMHLPLDDDGFLRRECPHCERQFKWYPSPHNESTAESQKDVDQDLTQQYHCPYCHQQASAGSWWTSEQVRYMNELVQAEALRPLLEGFKEQVGSLGNVGGMVQMDVQIPDMKRPIPLSESNDMVRVSFPCHPEEPLKVDENWDGRISCLVCGISYPVELVRPLPPKETDR